MVPGRVAGEVRDRSKRPGPAQFLRALAVLFFVTACAPSGSGTTVDETWATEAEAWISALRAAAGEQESEGRRRIADFYARGVVLEVESETHVGRVAVAEFERSLAASAASQGLGEVHLDHTGFAQTEYVTWIERGRPATLALRAWEIENEGITRATAFSWVDDRLVRDNPFGIHDASLALASSYVNAWNLGDTRALRTLYTVDASVVDSIGGVSATGRDAVLALAGSGPPAARLVPAWDVFPAAARDAPRSAEDAPAVFVTFGSSRTGSLPAEVALVLRTDRGCSRSSVVRLALGPQGSIARERRYAGLATARECDAGRELGPGWWTERTLPLPLSQRVTGSVPSQWGRVEIRNGAPELEALVRWGLGRFEGIDLPEPRLRSIAFDPFDPRCREHGAHTTGSGGSASILVCADAARVAADDDCPAAPCASASPVLDALLLHELGHAWLVTHAVAGDRDRFSTYARVRWDDPGDDPRRRGVELAATVIAWGLAESPAQRDAADAGLSCGFLAAGFEVLTGVQPRVDCVEAFRHRP